MIITCEIVRAKSLAVLTGIGSVTARVNWSRNMINLTTAQEHGRAKSWATEISGCANLEKTKNRNENPTGFCGRWSLISDYFPSRSHEPEEKLVPIGHVKVLRINQTNAERKLWSRLRDKQFYGYKFYRQYGVGQYIADFYCPKLKLIVEVDGGQHYEEKGLIKDTKRDEYFTSMHISVIRFNNRDVLTNIEGVLIELSKRTPPAPL